MPIHTNPSGLKTAKVGDTLFYEGKHYKLEKGVDGNRFKAVPIDMSKVKQQADTVKNFIKSKDVSTNKYRIDPLGLKQWDKDNPRKSVERPGSIMDKQNITQGVNRGLQEGYQRYVEPAFNVSLDMLESLENSGQISKDEIYNILSPKAKTDDPFMSGAAVDEWAKKYDPDYFKGTIHDKKVYESVKTFRNELKKKGPDFFVARTNINRQLKYDKNGKPIDPARYGSKDDLSSKIPQEWNIDALNKENYTSQVVQRIGRYAKENIGLSPVSNAIDQQGLGSLLTDANIFSLNMQDVKDFRQKTKARIIDDMYNNLKDREDILREFAQPIFNKENKFVGYDKENLRFQLDKSFDEAGNFDPNFIPYTNYNAALKRKNYNDSKLPGDFRSIDVFNPHKGGIEGYIDPENLKPWQKQELSQYQTFDKAMGIELSDIEQRSEKEALEKGYPIYADIGVGSYAPDVIPYSETAIGKIFSEEFEKAVDNIYKDKDDRNVLGFGYGTMGIPFVESVGPGGTGIGANALSKPVQLSAGKDSDAIFVWSGFKNDWINEDLKNKINGTDRLISFKGAGLVGYEASLGEDEDKGMSSEKGIDLINNFIEWIPGHKSTRFDLEAYKFAANNFDKSAMTLKFPESFLKEQLKAGVIDDTDLEDIKSNGATIIGGAYDFSNPLMQAQKTPLEAHIDYRKSYTWTHPTGLASYTIEKGDGANNDYRTITRWYGYDEENPGRLKVIEEQRNSVTRYGNNLNKALNNAVGKLTSDINKLINNQ